MMKPVSGLCNLDCQYCFYTDEMKKRKNGSLGLMSIETLENIIKKVLLFAEYECIIIYQGGEPTLAGLEFFKKSVEFQKKYNVNCVKIQNVLQTNGYILDKEWCQFFKENYFLIGLSLDGIKTTHDAYRKNVFGEDTYFRIMEAAMLLKQYDVEFNILTVVNAKTATKIRRIYEQYMKRGFYFQQYIACLDPIGADAGSYEYSLTPVVYGQMLIDLFELWELDYQKGKQPYIRQFENWIGILMRKEPEACEQRGICSIQNVIEADGSVYPCDFYALDDFCIGNLNCNTIEEIYSARTQIKFLEKSRNHPDKCIVCKYFALCRGGCRRHRENSEHLNQFCEAYKMFFDKYYSTLQKIALECIKK